MAFVCEENPSWSREPCMLGIDEAGRGPVLGPMVYSCVYCPISAKEEIAKRSFADSKTLTEDKRETLYELIAQDSLLRHASDALSAEFISSEMLSTNQVSLNAIASDSTCRLIQGVCSRGINITEVYVDTVGDADRYQQKLSGRFPGIDFTVCPKADALYPVVSAASIVAKVTRDRLLRNFSIEESGSFSTEFGSGYPGDPDTKVWMENNMDPIFGYPRIVRFSWQTCTTALDAKAVTVKWGSDEGGQQTLAFGAMGKAAQPTASSASDRHPYFRARRLQLATNFGS